MAAVHSDWRTRPDHATLANVKRQRPPGIATPAGLMRFGKQFGNDPYTALTLLQQTYGPVAEVSAGFGRKLVFLFGVEGNAFVLSDGKDHFEFHRAFQTLAPVVGKTALIVSDGQVHATRRALVQPAFRPHRIDAYLPQMRAIFDDAIDSLKPGQELDLYPLIRQATRRAVIQALFSDSLAAGSDRVGDTIEPALEFVNLPPQQQIHARTPGSKYSRALKARRDTDRLVDQEIDRRLTTPAGSENDVLESLLEAKDESGDRLSRVEIRDQIVSLIAAGYDTTSAAMTWLVRCSLSEEGVWSRLVEELSALPDDYDAAQLNAALYLDGVVHETLRLNPPGVVAARYAVSDFEFGGYQIARKSLVFYSPLLTQRDPSVWPDPLAFDPTRWHPDDRPRWAPAPHTFVPFGEGKRRCIGFGLAILELKVFLTQLVRRTVLQPSFSDDPRPIGMATVRPAEGVPVRVESVS